MLYRSFLAMALSLLVVGSTAVAVTPRYRLEPGQILTYESTRETKLPNASFESSGTWTLWVTGTAPEGGWRVIARAESVRTSIRGEVRRELWNKVWFGRFDVRPDGRTANVASFENAIDPAAIFVRLPRDEAEAATGWSWENPRSFTGFEARRRPAEGDGLVVFGLDATALTDAIYLVERDGRVTFDPAVGLISEKTDSKRMGWGSKSVERGRLELTGIERVDPSTLTELSGEVDRFVALAAAYRTACEKAQRDLSTLDDELEAARVTLAAARDDFQLEEIRTRLDEMLEIHGPRTNYHRDVAERRAALVGRPAPDWTLPDLAGREHALADYRGKVVVLDFWYRGCTWCVRSMPQLREVVRELADEPFVLLGVNTDAVLDDALFVERAMQLNYPSLQGPDLPDAYRVRAFPTLIMIGPDGIVREVHLGYDIDLGETVIREARALFVEGG